VLVIRKFLFNFLLINHLILVFLVVSCNKSELTREYSIEITDLEIEQLEEREVIIQYKLKVNGIISILEKGLILTTDPEVNYFTNRIKDTSDIDQVEKKYHFKLEGGLQFYVRPFVVTAYDTIYGETRSFMTGNYYKEGDGVTDTEGNMYKTVIIGNQEWMAENLRSATFCNGESIPLVDSLQQTFSFVDSESQVVLNYHGSDMEKVELYGYYYAGYTVIDERNICPCGWRIPRFEDVTELVVYLGDDNYVGGKMKSTGNLENGTGNWMYPNAQANNLSGLNIHGSGMYYARTHFFSDLYRTTRFFYLKEPTGWNYPYEEQVAQVSLQYLSELVDVQMGMGIASAFISVRCIKD
jgi:uncharacterized protein (TIGR02145 family)